MRLEITGPEIFPKHFRGVEWSKYFQISGKYFRAFNLYMRLRILDIAWNVEQGDRMKEMLE